jgi:hypothetical protein
VSKPIRPEYEGHRKKYRLLIKLTFGSLWKFTMRLQVSAT